MYKTVVKARGPLCSVLAMAIATTGVVAPSIAHAEEEAESSSGAIVVTARKREESLLEVPLAITAVSAEQIEQRGITSVTDLVDNTPGINVTSAASGRNDRSFQQISLRGFTPSTTSSTLTASFIDGVPVASATAMNAVIDPARIEVLRGPQNAYFGRNAFAGAINIVTKEPANEFGGSISAQWSERNGYDVSAAFEGPIVEDVLAFRLTGRSWGTDGGYTNSWNPNQTLGDQSTRSFTGQLTFTPDPDLTIKMFGMYSEDEDGPSPEGMISNYEVRAADYGAAGIGPNWPFLSGNQNGALVLASQSNCTVTGLDVDKTNPEFDPTNRADYIQKSRAYICGALPGMGAVNIGSNTPEDTVLAGLLAAIPDEYRVVPGADGAKGYGLVREYRHFHANVDYDFGDSGFTLSGLFGYNLEWYSEIDDLDQYDSSAFVNGTDRGYWNFPYMVERENEDISGELRLSYDDGDTLQAMLGVSYLNATAKGDLVNLFSQEQSGKAALPSYVQAPGRAETFGIFGSVGIDVTEELNISLEGRFQKDKIFALAGGAGVKIEEGNVLGAAPGDYAYNESYFNRTYDNFMPRAIISYDVTPDVMLYASYARAANISLNSFNTSFVGRSQAVLNAAADLGLEIVTEPETLDNFEVGMKGRFLDGRLLVTLAGYYGKWKDQYNNRSVIFPLESAGVELISGVANSGDVDMTGVELDIMAEPVDGLTFTFSGAMNDSSINSFDDPSITSATGALGSDFEGNQNPLTSKWSLNTGLMYAGEFDADKGYFLRTDLNWKSKQFIDASNTAWIKGRAVVNARAGFNFEGYKLEAFVTNVFDDKNWASASQSALLDPYFTMSTSIGGYGQFFVALPEPRTFGIKASYDF